MTIRATRIIKPALDGLAFIGKWMWLVLMLTSLILVVWSPFVTVPLTVSP